MDVQAFDLIVVGGGPGGYVAAIRAAQLGKKVALVEKERLGGTCLNWGCIPTKALLKSADLYLQMQKSETYGITHQGLQVDWAKIIGRSRSVTDQIVAGVNFLMKKNKITAIEGTAKLTSATTVEVVKAGEKVAELQSEKIVICAGARPQTIPGIEIDGEKIISSKEAMVISAQPKSIIIIGGGAIGVEFAYFFNVFGTKVQLLEMEKQLLPQEDEEVSSTLLKSFQKQGIETFLKTKVEGIESSDHGVSVKVKTESGEEIFTAEKVLMAIGVRANLKDLGLEELGVELKNKFIQVNENYQTNIPSIYAIGDIIGPPWLAHVASHEGIVAIEKLFASEKAHPIDYDNVPGCVYCQPQVASVGLNEKQAKEKGLNIKIGKFPFLASGKAKAMGDTSGFVKLIFEASTCRILGAQIIGGEATEMIAELGLAIRMGATSDQIFQTMHAHPTLAEAVMEAAGASNNQAIHL